MAAHCVVARRHVFERAGHVGREDDVHHVLLDRTTLRLSPHGLAPPVAALESGSAVWILRRSPGWVMVEAPGSQRGWLADEAVAAVGG